MKRTCEILAAVALMLVAASAVYAGGPVACGNGAVTWSPDTLWPPNHKLQTIAISYTQPCDDPSVPNGCAGGNFSVRVDDITSNEEPPGQGCGQPTPPQGLDFTGVGNSSGPVTGIEPITVATTVQVRAERCGNGNGRIYTIDVTCEEHGEIGTATLTVTVPHDLGNHLGNISTRGLVKTGDDVMIGGFIIEGSAPKQVLVRARGGSLANFGVPGGLGNPFLRIFSGQTAIAENDDWQVTLPLCQMSGHVCGGPSDIAATGLAPTDPQESAILITLAPGPYTAIVSGAGGTTGVGIVEIFELSSSPTSRLVNISTRGLVKVGDDVMIGGFIIEGSAPQQVLVRARGGSLANFGVPGVLGNPFLRIFSGQTPIAENDDWQFPLPLCQTTGHACGTPSDIAATGLAPMDHQESAILITLAPGPYTAIVSGAGDTTGVGIVEVFEAP